MHKAQRSRIWAGQFLCLSDKTESSIKANDNLCCEEPNDPVLQTDSTTTHKIAVLLYNSTQMQLHTAIQGNKKKKKQTWLTSSLHFLGGATNPSDGRQKLLDVNFIAKSTDTNRRYKGFLSSNVAQLTGDTCCFRDPAHFITPVFLPFLSTTCRWPRNLRSTLTRKFTFSDRRGCKNNHQSEMLQRLTRVAWDATVAWKGRTGWRLHKRNL